ncbi:MAG: FAD-dependent oxidoreductase, partial [Alphaproteobacteria bacterium]|nr:FAD-dependent oxidoreductase [Alphaproteobacteria bacterium]
MNVREESLRRLASGMPVDVLVIGGGVNGVAVLRDLALNGVSVTLLERGDFCQGASGASSRMAHGGLRYL